MKKFLIKQDDYMRTRELVMEIRKLIKERQSMRAFHTLNELNNILLNVKEAE